MFYCDFCGSSFTRKNNLGRHKKESCNYTNFNQFVVEKVRDNYTPTRELSTYNEDEVNSVSDHNKSSIENIRNNWIPGREIPTFDGDEFCGKKLKTRETINKIMQLVGVPEQPQEIIAMELLQELNANDKL